MYCSKESAESFHPTKMVAKANSDKSFKCDYCKKIFSSSASLAKHHKMHNISTSLRVKCFQKALYSKGLSKNLKMHSLFECTFCKKLFAHKSNLTRHLRIHSGEKPFECNLCGKSFTSSSNLVQHISTHAVQNPFKCGYCKKVFTKSSELTKHIQSHVETRPGRFSIKSSPQSDILSNFSSMNLAWSYQQQQQQQPPLHAESQQQSPQMTSHSTSSQAVTTQGEMEGKPDHTYCSGSSQQQQNLPSKERNAVLSKSFDVKTKNKSYLIESTNQPLGPDHTYWSTSDHTQNNGKKKAKVTKEPKPSHSNLSKMATIPAKHNAKLKLDSGLDHTYCTGGSNHKKCQEMFPENHNPDLESSGSKSRKETCLNLKNCGSYQKPDDHTYSSGGNKSSGDLQKAESRLDLTPALKANQITSIDHVDPDHTYSVDLDLDVISIGQEPGSETEQPVDSVNTVCHSQPDHTYCHEKSQTPTNKVNKDGVKRSNKQSGSGCLKDCPATVSPNQDFLDHTYCFGEQLANKTTNDNDNDHTYCSDNGHLQNITCSDDWSSGMKFDHTYCLVRTVSRHF